jgi:hypothetical protein
MVRLRRIFAFVVVGGVLLTSAGAWASTALAAQHRKKHKKKVVKVEVPVAPVPVEPPPPPPPLRPFEEPAVAPQVTYDKGQLLIEAKNSTLSDVLHAVEKNTGATFEISSGDTNERVMGRIGPGPARDVLAELLNGSHFNYVMLSPTGNPTALSKVLMTPKARGPEGGAGAPPPQTAQFQPQYQQPVQISPALQVQQQNAAAEQSADNGDTQDENADNNGDAQAAEAQDQGEAVQTDPQAQQQTPGVRTPEQLLQELQQRQQQLQQPGQQPVPPERQQ